MKKITVYISAFVFAALTYKAQDYHLSHYDVATLYYNPATTGMYGREVGDYRVYADQRSQWRALGIKPFTTTYIGYDMPVHQWGKNLGLGGYIINNNGGIGNFNTLTFMVSGAYDILNQRKKGISIESSHKDNHLLTFGLQMGLFYRSTNPNSLNYDIQYNINNAGGTFDQSIPNNEAYNRINITRFDANYGLYYRYLERGKKYHPYAGFSMSHITKPNESLTGGMTRIPIRFMLNTGCDFKLDDKMDITPRFLYMNQAKDYDFTMGFLFYYRINENGTRVYGGFDYRWKDACFISLGLKHENYQVRLSYDINTSYLKNYTNGRGAFEISLIYIGEKGKSFFKSVSSF